MPKGTRIVMFESLNKLPARRACVAAAALLVTGIPTVALGAFDLRAVAVSGQPAPQTGPNVRYSSLELPIVNSAGGVTFDVFLAGDGVNLDNQDALYAGAPGAVMLVARG